MLKETIFCSLHEAIQGKQQEEGALNKMVN